MSKVLQPSPRLHSMKASSSTEISVFSYASESGNGVNSPDGCAVTESSQSTVKVSELQASEGASQVIR